MGPGDGIGEQLFECTSFALAADPVKPQNDGEKPQQQGHDTDEIDLYQRRFIYELSRWLAIA